MRYYFLGIGGISMSALAILLNESGHKVSGSDCCENFQTAMLQNLKIDVYFQPNFNEIDKAEIIVVSSAIGEDNAELIYAKSCKKKIISRGQMLGEIASGYKNVIAVSGAHGKTTTTALIAKIFCEASKNPTVHLGGNLCENNTNVIVGGKDFFITEACEYKNNFLFLRPKLGIILNVEAEHLDFFKSFENVKKSFVQFASYSENLINLSEILPKNLKFSYKNYRESINGLKFDCLKNGEFYGKIACCLHGEHNVKNILVAIQCADFFEIDKDVILAAIKKFQGVKCRFEKHDFKNGSNLIFDYAHHPTEIKNSIEIAKKLCKGKLYIIFQPHTYSRTKILFDEFVKCFYGFENVTIFKTFAAREEFDKQGDGLTLAKALNCDYSEDYNLLNNFSGLIKNDGILVLGAGDFYSKCTY